MLDNLLYLQVLVVALVFATAFKTILYEREVKVHIGQLKKFSALFKKSEKHQFAGNLFLQHNILMSVLQAWGNV